MLTGVAVTAVAVLPALGGAGGGLATIGFLAPALGGLAASASAMLHPGFEGRARRTLAFLSVLGGIVGGLSGAVLLFTVLGFLPVSTDLPAENRLALGAAAAGGVAGLVVFARAAEAFAADTFRWKRGLAIGLAAAVVGTGLWVASILVDIAQREAAGLDTTGQSFALFGAYIPAILYATVATVAGGGSPPRPET